MYVLTVISMYGPYVCRYSQGLNNLCVISRICSSAKHELYHQKLLCYQLVGTNIIMGLKMKWQEDCLILQILADNS